MVEFNNVLKKCIVIFYISVSFYADSESKVRYMQSPLDF